MLQEWFHQLDQILRGELTKLSALRSGSINISLAGLVVILLLLGMFYGGCIGFYSLVQSNGENYMQILASVVKIPLLFFLTLNVTFPSLYVFNTLIGVRLSVPTALQILTATLGVMMTVMASLGPIVIFFSLSTSSYPFIVILNVIVCSISGILGLSFLLRTLDRLVVIQEEEEYEAIKIQNSLEVIDNHDSTEAIEADASLAKKMITDNQSSNRLKNRDQTNSVLDKVDRLITQKILDDHDSSKPLETDASMAKKAITDNQSSNKVYKQGQTYSALDKVDRFTRKKAKSVFRIWIIVFALVGAQMSWVLRPFIGSPDKPFTFFREQEGNFFIRVFESIISLLVN